MSTHLWTQIYYLIVGDSTENKIPFPVVIDLLIC